MLFVVRNGLDLWFLFALIQYIHLKETRARLKRASQGVSSSLLVHGTRVGVSPAVFFGSFGFLSFIAPLIL